MASSQDILEVISTGNGEIDKKLGGGIPAGSLTIIEGASDSGKSVLAQQMIWGSLKNNHTVSLITTENTGKSLVRQMQSLNLDIVDYYLLGRLKIYPIKVTGVTDDVGITVTSLLYVLRRQGGPSLVVIDSVTSFIAHSSVEQTIAFFEECKTHCNRGMTIIVVAHSYAFGESTMIRISSMCDAHLHLSTESLGQKLVKALEVSKVRGAAMSTGNIVTFDVEPGLGMRIMPFAKARV